MAIRIKFDSTHNAIIPTFVLATRSGRKLGAIPAKHISIRDAMNTYSELQFSVYKEENGVRYHLWDKLKDFKLVYCKEWDTWFEIYVEIDETNKLVKNISAKSLGEAELSQIRLYNIEINTEIDISRDDYEPTVLFDEGNANASLLDRIMEKAPHYKIKHVAASIMSIQRTFTFNDISLYDAFQEIAEEINCIFVISSGSDGNGKIERSISVYDLESYCVDCGKRDSFVDKCPYCGSENILEGYGKDTSIFVSTENLAENITYSTDIDSVKNCFKLIAGDDLMTATIANCNPNGGGYIWHVSEESKEDMSDALVAKLNSYDSNYEYYQNDHVVSISSNLLTKYNSLVDKYASYTDGLQKIPTRIVGYPALMNAYYNTIDLYLLLDSSLMPKPTAEGTTAALEARKLTAASLSPVAVQDITKCSSATASSAVLAMAKVAIDPKYFVSVENGVLDGNTWTGKFVISGRSKEEDIASSSTVTITINDDPEEYLKEKLDKSLSGKSDGTTDIVALFKLSDSAFKTEIGKYSLARLVSFHDACQACLDILIENGVGNRNEWQDQTPNLYQDLYVPYHNKLNYLSDEIKERESEIAVIVGTYGQNGKMSGGVQTEIERARDTIQSSLDFETYLGDDLWLEFLSYRREDTYQNDNYISDGLDNAQLFDNALAFIEAAKKDIFKSATLQHSITSTLKNLLVMKEFYPIIDHFEVGSWLRVQVDSGIYKLRLIDYEVNFDELDRLMVTFSDVKSTSSGISDIESILDQANSIAGSFDSVSRQAEKGKNSNAQLENWVEKGLALTNMKIVGDVDNQNITWDSHGILCREYLPITDEYDDKQLKIINRGLYLTDDNWTTSRCGVGNFTFYNPATEKTEYGYGVIADTLIGNLILSENVGIYNTKNSITLDENGLVITTNNTTNTSSQIAFTIQKKTLDTNGEEYLSKIMYIDSDGELVLNGSVRINSAADSTVSTVDDVINPERLKPTINEIVQTETGILYTSITQEYQAQIKNTQDQLDQYKADIGQFMTFDENGLTLGAESSQFKTVIDNRGLWFKQGNSIISYVNNNQLYIQNAVITNSLVLCEKEGIGSLFFSQRDDGGVSLTWQSA